VSEPQRPQQRNGALRRIAGVVFVVELTIGAIALMLILILVFLQALQRYLPIEGFAWTGEVARFSLVWLTFSAAGLLVTTRGHIALEIVDAIPNQTVVRVIQVFALVVVAATGVGLAIAAWALVDTQGIIKSPVLRLPMSWVYIPVLIGAISTAIRAAVAAVDVALHGPALPAPELDETEATA
jgi:TRAP-type C4-dicarboxylate transport system permease small subunit